MGTWCTEGVKRTIAEHRRQEADAKERKCRKECEEKGICPECGQKIIKKRKDGE